MTRWLVILFFTFFCAKGVAAPDSKLWQFWDVSDECSHQVVDHSKWQQVLDEYLEEGDDGVNRFAYMRAAEERSGLLNAYLAEMSEIDPRALSMSEQMAYWINLYNALTVQVVLGYPDKKTILRMRKRLLSIGPWDDELITIAGEAVTLNDIEHRILRPIWQDHRVHFAVNCASIGCPNLNQDAYTSENIERLLAESERGYLNHDRGAFVRPDGSVRLSSIFKWYREDFAESETELLEYIASINPSLRTSIENRKTKIRYDYDWSLNSAPNQNL